MANSPAHKFGQIIGDLLEEATIESIRPFVKKHGMYLDSIHKRPARGNKVKVRWEDINGNFHDLDLVIEENGSESRLGEPRAFIEVAWRRYTKHSKNKAQEISGAVSPIAEKYFNKAPFKGAVLAGEFTQTSIEQLRSEGFAVLHFSYDEIVHSFGLVGVDARFDERTPEKTFSQKVMKFEALSNEEREKIKENLFQSKTVELNEFLDALDKSLERSIRTIFVSTMYGSERSFASIEDAYSFIMGARTTSSGNEPLSRIDIRIEYTNGDAIQLSYGDPKTAASKLRALA